VLTVRAERLGLQPGDRVLDLGAGLGRHAHDAARRGARVVALDLSPGDLAAVAATATAMRDAGELPAGASVVGVRADGRWLPFADGAFDRVVASEVFEHVDDDGLAAAEVARVLRPGGVVAVTVPTWFPERVCWALSSKYHAPAVAGGHVRVYRAGGLRAVLEGAGLRPEGSHHAHALHAPYWWLRCAVGPRREDHPAVRRYRAVLEWDIVRAPRTTRWAERALNPVLGKSLVVYARKPVAAG
jgi:SAM-dependent methyltransferase